MKFPKLINTNLCYNVVLSGHRFFHMLHKLNLLLLVKQSHFCVVTPLYFLTQFYRWCILLHLKSNHYRAKTKLWKTKQRSQISSCRRKKAAWLCVWLQLLVQRGDIISSEYRSILQLHLLKSLGVSIPGRGLVVSEKYEKIKLRIVSSWLRFALYLNNKKTGCINLNYL